MRSFGKRFPIALGRYSTAAAGRGRGRGVGDLPIGAAHRDGSPQPRPSPNVGSDVDVVTPVDVARGRGRGRGSSIPITLANHNAPEPKPREVTSAASSTASSKTLSAMLLAYISAGQLEKVEDVVTRLLDNGLVPEPAALSGAVTALARAGKVSAVDRLLQEAERERSEVDITALGALIELYANQGDIQKMEAAAARLDQRSQSSPSSSTSTAPDASHDVFGDAEDSHGDVALTRDERQAIRHRMKARGALSTSQSEDKEEDEEEEEEEEHIEEITLSPPPSTTTPPPQEASADVVRETQQESVKEMRVKEPSVGVEELKLDNTTGRPQPALSGRRVERDGSAARARVGGRGAALPPPPSPSTQISIHTSPSPSPSIRPSTLSAESSKKRPPIGAPVVRVGERGAGRGAVPPPPPPPSIKAEPLSREDALSRALSVMAQGVQRQQERSRRASVDQFSIDISGRQRPQYTQYSQSPGASRQDHRHGTSSGGRSPAFQPSRQRARQQGGGAGGQTAQLSEEAQKIYDLALFERDLEDSIGRQLQAHFSVHFEPEYLMDTSGTNPEIEDGPMPSLQEFMDSAKEFLVQECDIQSEEQWQEQRDSLLDRGPALEALVESYTGHRHLSAAQQRDGLKAIVDKVPDSAGPAAKAFAVRSLATLQINPSYSYAQKVTMITRLTDTLASS